PFVLRIEFLADRLEPALLQRLDVDVHAEPQPLSAVAHVCLVRGAYVAVGDALPSEPPGGFRGKASQDFRDFRGARPPERAHERTRSLVPNRRSRIAERAQHARPWRD